MPHNTIQWLWFIFYTVGALGGWLCVILAVLTLMSNTQDK